MPPDYHAFIWDMREHLLMIERLTHGLTLADVLGDDARRLAVERCIMIVGEAANRVPRHDRERHPEIPWDGIVRQRNVLAHMYGGLDWDRLWGIVETHAPALRAQLDAIVIEPPTEPNT
ncbi:MAG: DUF86 domain-containing protein [Phycisphaerales bacterium]|nr:MAG: DUF86 domain-containing protein [Phycisphaerales bacterium]